MYRNASNEDRTAVEALLVAFERQLTNPSAQNNLSVVEAGTVSLEIPFPFVSSGDFGGRTSWYDRWQPVSNGVQPLIDKLQVAALGPTSAITSTAKTDFGEFIALKTLSPFALKARTGQQSALDSVWSSVHGADHLAWTADKNARLSGDTTKQFDFTDAWYSDRSELLRRLLTVNQYNEPAITDTPSSAAQPISLPTIRWCISIKPRTSAFGNGWATPMHRS